MDRLYKPDEFGPYIESCLSRALEKSGGNIDPGKLLREGAAAESEGRTSDAVALMQVLLPIQIDRAGLGDPGSVQILGMLSGMYLNMGQLPYTVTAALMAYSAIPEGKLDAKEQRIQLLRFATLAASKGDQGQYSDAKAIMVDRSLELIGLLRDGPEQQLLTAAQDLAAYCKEFAPDDKEALGNALFWVGDVLLRQRDYVGSGSALLEALTIIPHTTEYDEVRSSALQLLAEAQRGGGGQPQLVVTRADGTRSVFYDSDNAPDEIKELLEEAPNTGPMVSPIPIGPTAGLPSHQVDALKALSPAERIRLFEAAMDEAMAANDLRSMMRRGLTLIESGFSEASIPDVNPEIASRFNAMLVSRQNLNPWPLLAAALEEELVGSESRQNAHRPKRIFIFIGACCILLLIAALLFLLR